jgi:hypothetical protein
LRLAVFPLKHRQNKHQKLFLMPSLVLYSIYRNTGIDRQATLLFGLSFPDKEALSDAQAVEKLYREGMKAQSGGTVIRTADLPNPFTTSIRTTPAQPKSNYSGESKSAEAPSDAAPESAVSPSEPAPRGRG